MLEHQYYALAACLVLFAAALAYSAKSAREYHIWYKKEKEEAKARDLLKKMQSTGEAPLDLGTGDGKTESLSEERAVARKACPFAKFAEDGAKCPVSGESNSLSDSENEGEKESGTASDSGALQYPSIPGKSTVNGI